MKRPHSSIISDLPIKCGMQGLMSNDLMSHPSHTSLYSPACLGKTDGSSMADCVYDQLYSTSPKASSKSSFSNVYYVAIWQAPPWAQEPLWYPIANGVFSTVCNLYLIVGSAVSSHENFTSLLSHLALNGTDFHTTRTVSVGKPQPAVEKLTVATSIGRSGLYSQQSDMKWRIPSLTATRFPLRKWHLIDLRLWQRQW